MAVSLKSVINQIQKDGEKTRQENSASNADITTHISITNHILNNQFKDLIETIKGNSLAALEEKREQDEYNRDLLAAIEGLQPPPPAPAVKEEETGTNLMGLSLVLTGVIGTVIGAATAQLKAIKTVGTGIAKLAKFLSPDSVKLLGEGIKARFFAVAAKISRVVQEFFTLKDGSRLQSVFQGIKSAFTSIAKPFVAAFETIKGLGQSGGKIGEVFSKIGSYFKAFGASVGKVAGIMSKIFYPITLVISAFSTLKGAIDGFAEGGIVGALQGAMEGLFDALIGTPLNLIKDAVSWILGALGFDKAEKALDSFDFNEMFGKVMDVLFMPFKWLQDKIVGLGKWVKEKIKAMIPDSVANFFGLNTDELDTEAEAPNAYERKMARLKQKTGAIKAKRDAIEGQVGANALSKGVLVSGIVSNATSMSPANTLVQRAPGVSAIDLNNANQENKILSSTAAAGAGTNINAPSNSNTTINNNTTVQKVSPAPTRPANSMDDMYYLGGA